VIIDCSTYFMEADLLELRFCELDPVVDWFVVVEGDRTHAGNPKPSYLPRDLVLRWQHKLSVVTAHLPEGDGLVWTWRREIAQRNAIADALARLRCQPDDMILISDCDEIPRRGFVGLLAGMPQDGIAIAQQRLSYYTLNHIGNTIWQGTRATQYANVQALSPDGVRYADRARGGFPHLYPVANAGWHLSYFGGAERVQTKIASFLHQELNSPEVRDAATIAARIEAGADVYGREEQSFTIGPAHDLPDAIYERPKRWLAHFHPSHAPRFTEDWMGEQHSARLAWLARQAPQDGLCVEIGSWEGASTIALAHALRRPLIAVDTWAGNLDEGDDHPSVQAAAARDVYAQFVANLAAFSITTVTPQRMDWRDWAATDAEPLAFVFLDAAHDVETVAAQIRALAPRLVPGGILCGDDWHAPGVRLALTLLDGVESDGKIWWWGRAAE
jgi:beta-1,4-mannosyl-glycoprotein beta-1,4-N-acetylglucosaminyltransferase